MLADPQSVTYATVAKNLPAISRGESSSKYQLNDGSATFELQISHAFKARNRVVARLSRETYVADPIHPTQFILAGMTATVTMDFPRVGLLPSDAQALAKALVGYLTDATILKLANGET